MTACTSKKLEFSWNASALQPLTCVSTGAGSWVWGDNLSEICACEQGRTQDPALRVLLQQALAWSLVSGSRWKRRYIESERNPSDFDSRLFAKRGQRILGPGLGRDHRMMEWLAAACSSGPHNNVAVNVILDKRGFAPDHGAVHGHNDSVNVMLLGFCGAMSIRHAVLPSASVHRDFCPTRCTAMRPL